MFARFFRRSRSVFIARQKPCLFCQGDLVKQAYQQLRAGGYIGATASVRCHLEQRLRFLTKEAGLLRHKSFSRRPKAGWMLDSLRGQGMLPRNLYRRLIAVFARAGVLVHGGPQCNAIRARWVVEEAEALAEQIDDLILGVSLFEPEAEKARARHIRRRGELQSHP